MANFAQKDLENGLILNRYSFYENFNSLKEENRLALVLYKDKASDITFGVLESVPSGYEEAFIDISNSSRKNERPGEPLSQSVVSKIISQMEKTGTELDSEKLLSLYADSLGENNLNEQAHMLFFVVAPISLVMRMQEEKFGFASQERSTRYVDFISYFVPESISAISKTAYSKAVTVEAEARKLVMQYFVDDISSKLSAEMKKRLEEKEIETLVVPSARDISRSFVSFSNYTVAFFSVNEAIFKRMLQKLSVVNTEPAKILRKEMKEYHETFHPLLSKHQDGSDLQKLNEENYREPFRKIYNKKIDAFSVFSFSSAKVKISDLSSTEDQILGSIEQEFKVNALAEISKISKMRKNRHDLLFDTILNRGEIIVEVNRVSAATARDLCRHRSMYDTRFEVSDGFDRQEKSNQSYIEPYFVLDDRLLSSRIKQIAINAIKEAVNSYNIVVDEGYADSAVNLLPISIGGKLFMRGSLASFIYMIENRTTKEAHPEYRNISMQILEGLKHIYPTIFREFEVKTEKAASYLSRSFERSSSSFNLLNLERGVAKHNQN
ncbi:MAG: FAD-dependent thymidylate synthase [Candidatus Micrarchaeia archaeon]